MSGLLQDNPSSTDTKQERKLKPFGRFYRHPLECYWGHHKPGVSTNKRVKSPQFKRRSELLWKRRCCRWTACWENVWNMGAVHQRTTLQAKNCCKLETKHYKSESATKWNTFKGQYCLPRFFILSSIYTSSSGFLLLALILSLHGGGALRTLATGAWSGDRGYG